MSEVRWTPGPWIKNRYGELVGRNGERVDVYDAGIRLTLASPDDVDRANAHLIAAAPELAEALEKILKWVRPIAGDNRDIEAAAKEEDSVFFAENALKKARGEL